MKSKQAKVEFKPADLYDDNMLTNARRAEAWRSLLGFGVTGLGVGAIARGLKAFVSPKPHDPRLDVAKYTPGPIRVFKDLRDDEEEKQAVDLGELASELVKAAEGEPWYGKRPGADWADKIAPSYPSSITTSPARHSLLDPVGIPLATATTAGGLYGGWKLVDWLLKQKNTSDTDTDLEDAKKQFYDTIATRKTAAARELDALYDEIEEVEKQAGAADVVKNIPIIGKGLNDYGQMATGGYLAAVLGLTAASGYAGYSWAKGRGEQQKKKLKDALRRRRIKQLEKSAPRLHAVPADEQKFELSYGA